ncbi:adenylosuccinate synthetase protein (macronuclear) [Tetrahymena thermophila SB210]|uniref:Adenylosuccinate synthetase n=1 Tax=Tetrahymena thermophila (strain SB210) TaxID=312017 RepID=I7M603_TETTS|nr:adenylosuccinate synthetase protein [Tetrahymena thermophila SB210]EAR83959.1 adenylosuccinate synthetase protein [Tetrahymena thermophila SB210]|eukprot:XP_001031622.1 adenylosuccinate synthetase protein [Tetrahymena thermophila SB210]
MSVAKQTARCLNGLKSNVAVVLGAQWGDEGKGKLVDILAEKYEYCARFNGGANAGHTIIANGKKYPFHLLPCGILYPHTKNVLGNGTVIHLQTMFEELKQLDRDHINYKGRLLLSDRAHLVTSLTIAADSKSESSSKNQFLGTTKRGIGPTYASKMNRYGLRVGDLKNWDTFLLKYKYLQGKFSEQGVNAGSEEELQEIKLLRERMLANNMITDTVVLMNEAIKQGKRVLVEGANACLLDIDFGTYPYVTSSNTSIGGVCTGLGIAPHHIETVIGIVKAYTTRVGEGPFPTELNDQNGEHLRKVGHEFGTTTGRPRRCGWLDIPLLRYSHMINNYQSINITKLDVLDQVDEIKIATKYTVNGEEIHFMPSTIEELSQVKVEYTTVKGWNQDISKIRSYDKLPQKAKDYLSTIEELLGVPVSWVGTGPEREAMVLKQ